MEWPLYEENSFQRSIRVYKHTQLLNKLYNIVFGRIFVPAAKVIILIGLFILSYCIVKLRAYMSTPMLLVFILDAFTASTLILPGALTMSLVYSTSREFYKNVSRNLESAKCARTKLFYRKKLISMPELKCNVGNLYYMESKAKLTLADTMINGVCFMLLSF